MCSPHKLNHEKQTHAGGGTETKRFGVALTTSEHGDMTLHVFPHSLRGSEVISFAVQQGCALVEWKDQIATQLQLLQLGV